MSEKVIDRVTSTTGQEPSTPSGYRAAESQRRWARRARRTVAVLLPFVVWWTLAEIANNRLFPGPIEVIATLVDVTADGTIWFHAQQTAQRGLTGLAIAVVGGVFLGVGMASVRWMDSVLEPLVSATYPIPKLALFPLLVLALGFGAESKIVMVTLECAYPVILTTYAATRGVDKHYLWLARNVGAGPLARFGIIMRATSTSMVATLRMALPIMLVIMVVTELISESRGLGYLLRRASSDFDPELTMAVVLLLAIVGFVLDRLVVLLGDFVGRWAGKVQL
ncbi:ABC transporter permease [Cryobacterium sp. Y50]|uniref:ABC transporter permease n=1 Tax=Cryobacterium sp. Y50 TaxID=2048286 RepID=UPI000CE51CA7|nr:ABC transporter permease [Cryobacterium sp. Y50]